MSTTLVRVVELQGGNRSPHWSKEFVVAELALLHSRFRRKRDAKEFFVLSGPAFIFNAVYDTVFILTCVWAFLPWSLVWTNADFFIFLGAGIPQVKLIGDVTTDGHAFRIEQSDAVCARRIEPIIRLAKHLRHEELHSRCSGNSKLV